MNLQDKKLITKEARNQNISSTPVCFYCKKPVCQCQASIPEEKRVCNECIKQRKLQANNKAKKSI